MRRALDDDPNYNSEEDEDYVPSEASGEDEPYEPPPALERDPTTAAARGARGRASLQKKRKRKRVGAAVISDSDEDDLYNAPPAPAAATVASAPAVSSPGAQEPAQSAVDDLWAELQGSSKRPCPQSAPSATSVAQGQPVQQQPHSSKPKTPSAVDALWAELNEESAPKKSNGPAPWSAAAAAATVSVSGTGTTGANAATVDALWEDLNDDEPVLPPKRTDSSNGKAESSAAAKSTGKNVIEEKSSGGTVEIKNHGKDLVDMVEVVEYAGESVEVVRQVKRGSAEEARLKKKTFKPKKSKSDLSSLLASMAAPKQLSTVDKSKLDWQKNKEKTGDAHELAQYTKDGFIEKQSFLMKVDLRQFEQEKNERNRRRAQQSAPL